MNKVITHILYTLLLIVSTNCTNQKIEKTESNYIIPKDNGRIILAYKAFEDFLNSDRNWESYQKILLDAYPEMQIVHNRQLSWGVIDSLKFPEELKNYKREDLEHYFNQYDEKSLN
ncbi:unnamed protein product, partial [marine sediment metagenome]